MPTVADKRAAIPPEYPVRRFSVDEYHRMIDAGILGADDERFELLEGWIVAPMTRKPPHDVSIDLTADALRKLVAEVTRIRVQAALTLSDSEPEPDIAVVRGQARDYVKRHPGPEDTLLVVEVSDSSIGRDRQIKSRVYGRAGIPLYWIIDVVRRRVEVYSEPTGPAEKAGFRQKKIFGEKDKLPLAIAGVSDVQIPVRELLP